MAYHDLPAELATKGEIMKALAAKSIPADEIEMIRGFFDRLEAFKSATDLTSGIEFEQTRLQLLQYVKDKVTTPDP